MKKIALLIITLVMVGCAQTTGYRPTIDAYGDQRYQYINQDAADCEAIAGQSSVGKGIATDGFVGALVGAAGGAALGAVIGNPATGAAIGAAAGGIGGGAKGGIEADQTYKRIFRNCMQNRGHRTLN
jgi:uncharacterized membrane protein YebE (DUF533 family)